MKLFLVITLVGVVAALQKDRLFIIESPNEEDGRKMVVTWTEDPDRDGPGCEIFSDQHLISAVLYASGDEVVVRPTYEEAKELLEECESFSIRRRRRQSGNEDSSSEDEDSSSEDKDSSSEEEPKMRAARGTTAAPEGTTVGGYDGWNVIFPGTKWCGAGDIAKNYDDLGLHQDTDRCCRAHDFCDDLLNPGETRNNLTNTSPFTKLSCKCDNDFYDCLDNINTLTSNTIGNTYFNVLARSCYEKRRPTTDKCKKYKTFLKLICSEYEVDMKAPMEYQWVKARRYKKIPFPGPLTITLPF